MPKGECPKCNKVFYGWYLLQGSQISCPECGTPLNITDDSRIDTPEEKIDNSVQDFQQ